MQAQRAGAVRQCGRTRSSQRAHLLHAQRPRPASLLHRRLRQCFQGAQAPTSEVDLREPQSSTSTPGSGLSDEDIPEPPLPWVEPPQPLLDAPGPRSGAVVAGLTIDLSDNGLVPSPLSALQVPSSLLVEPAPQTSDRASLEPALSGARQSTVSLAIPERPTTSQDSLAPTRAPASPEAPVNGLVSSAWVSLQQSLASGALAALTRPPPAATDPANTSPFAPDKVWALLILSATYIHQAASSNGIPVMLPMISQSLLLTDYQGALLTTGYTCVYALALVPAGILADRVPRRSTLLGASVGVWSVLAFAASQAGGFAELLVYRLGLAFAQSTQNVVCFSVIPDIFPQHKSTAVSLYNCAIYCGRGLMYLAFNAARLASQTPEAIDAVAQAAVQRDAYGNVLVPLDQLDLRLVQIMYTTGDMAAIRASTPFYGIDNELIAGAGDAASKAMTDGVWRPVLEALAIPGALLTAALLFTVREPPRSVSAATPPPATITAITAASGSGAGSAALALAPSGGGAAAAAEAAAVPAPAATAAPDARETIKRLFTCPAFMVTTAGAALNDVASFGMIAWQSTFYERVYHLSIDQYAPALAGLLPISGIIGGVGGGLLADRLALKGHRAWITAATSVLAGPLIWGSLTAQTPQESFLCLAAGFALSEAWRAPAAVMARSVVAPNQASTAMSLYLCVRNVIGSLGPILVAQMSEVWDLQRAMELLPIMYSASGLLFWWAEHLLAEYNRTHPTETDGITTPAEQSKKKA